MAHSRAQALCISPAGVPARCPCARWHDACASSLQALRWLAAQARAGAGAGANALACACKCAGMMRWTCL
eukprot:15471408-Alexandrium_andersonii.AAC.1